MASIDACTVRPARPDDKARIVAFQAALALDTEGERQGPLRLDAGVAAVLADPARGRYLVAERDGAVVGALMLASEWSDGWFLWIESVFVAPDARRTGVYSALYARVLAEAEAREDVCGVRLHVEAGNARAQRVYEAFGMRRAPYLFYEVACPGAAATGSAATGSAESRSDGQETGHLSSVGGMETAP